MSDVKASSILLNELRKQHGNVDHALIQVREDAAVGTKIFQLRKQRGLTQKELAKQVGTTATVISRLENADYAGHSVSMLKRIADALDAKLTVNFAISSSRAGRPAKKNRRTKRAAS